MTPLEKLKSLDRTKQTAFFALFAGARQNITIYRNTESEEVRRPFFGKAECEWVDDWLDFYGRELPELGLTTWTLDPEVKPALGMAPGWTYQKAAWGITDAGWEARETYWDRPAKAANNE